MQADQPIVAQQRGELARLGRGRLRIEQDVLIDDRDRLEDGEAQRGDACGDILQCQRQAGGQQDDPGPARQAYAGHERERKEGADQDGEEQAVQAGAAMAVADDERLAHLEVDHS